MILGHAPLISGEGCALQNGNLVKGKIIVSASRNFAELTKSISISFVNFITIKN
jgi:hypothetical protein